MCVKKASFFLSVINIALLFLSSLLTFPPFPLIKPSAGLPWPSRQLRASGSICRPGLLREICWLTGNDTYWELEFPQDSPSACLPARLPACLPIPWVQKSTLQPPHHRCFHHNNHPPTPPHHRHRRDYPCATDIALKQCVSCLSLSRSVSLFCWLQQVCPGFSLCHHLFLSLSLSFLFLSVCNDPFKSLSSSRACHSDSFRHSPNYHLLSLIYTERLSKNELWHLFPPFLLPSPSF